MVGSSFRFGHKRAGDAGLMREFLERRGIAFDPVDSVEDDGRISSTRIRGLVAEASWLDEADIRICSAASDTTLSGVTSRSGPAADTV